MPVTRMTKEELAFTLKQQFPELREFDNEELVKRVVGRKPQIASQLVDWDDLESSEAAPAEETVNGVRFTKTEQSPPFNAGRASADLLRGAGAGAGKTVAGLGELATRLFNALKADLATRAEPGTAPESRRDISDAFMRDDASTAPFDALRQIIDQETPDTTAAKVGETGERIAEFMLPGAAMKVGGPLLPAMGREAAAAGVVGSIQKGELDPASAVGGAGGAALARGLGAGARFFGDRAKRVFSTIVRPRGEHMQGQVTDAIADLVQGGNVPVGGINTLADKLTAHADELAQRVADFRSGAAKAIPTDDIVQELVVARQALHGAESGQVLDPTMLAQVDEILAQVQKLATTPARRFLAPAAGAGTGAQVGANPEALEEILRTASNRIYAMASDPAAGTARAGLQRGADAVRAGLNTALPGREAATVPFSNARALADSVQAQASGAPFKEPSQAGQILALSGLGAGAGAAVGANTDTGAGTGAAIGAALPLLGSRLLKSPLWRSFSAAQQAKLAQILTSVPKEQAARLINSLLQTDVGEPEP